MGSVALRHDALRRSQGHHHPQKTDAEDNRGDPFTKPEAGALFAKHRRLLLGLDYQAEFDSDEEET